MEDRNQVLCAQTQDFLEGVAAFLEKRAPHLARERAGRGHLEALSARAQSVEHGLRRRPLERVREPLRQHEHVGLLEHRDVIA